MLNRIVDFIVINVIGLFRWTFLKFFVTGRTHDLKPLDREYARDLMELGLFLWVSRRETHLSTYLIGLADWGLSLLAWARHGFKGKCPKFGYWSHAFFNISGNEIVEAVGKNGVQLALFDQVFDCDAVAALIPRHMSLREWSEISPLVVAELKKELGKPYDSLFNLSDESRVSCIELVRIVLKRTVSDYDQKFADFENVIRTHKNVTPQMLFDSTSFEVVWGVSYK